MDPELQQLYDALRAAHAAGDTANATKLADYIRQRATPAPKTWGQDPVAAWSPKDDDWKAIAPKPEPTAAGVVDAATRGVSPYAIAAGTGGALGSVIPGVGTVAGAGFGATGLALTDAAAFGWNNTAASWFGAPKMMSGSDAILALTDMGGITKPVADDPNARIAYNAANLGASAVGGGAVMNLGGKALSRVPFVASTAPRTVGANPTFMDDPLRNIAAGITQTPSNIGNFFSKPIANSTLVTSGALGGGASQAATEMGADPLTAMAVGAGASMLGGGPKTPTSAVKAPTGKSLRAAENAAYEASKQLGIEWTPQAVDDIVNRAVSRAVAGSTADTGMSLGSVPASVTSLLDELSGLAQKQGRLYLKDVETYRQRIGDAVRKLPNTGGLKKTGSAILEQFDALTATPEGTLNAARGSVARARTALQQAEAAATATKTPEAVAAAENARVNLERAQKALRAQDPDIKPLAQASAQADDAVARADRANMDAQAEYGRMSGSVLDDARQAKLDAQTAYDRAAKKFAGRTDFNLQMARYRDRLAAATDAERIAVSAADKAKAAADNAASVLAKAEAKAISAEDALLAREAKLTAVDDAAARMAERNRLLEEGRALVPDRKRTEAFEKMPEAAAVDAGSSGLRAQTLRRQVQAFMQKNEGREFRQLPEETRRQLERFVKGGSITQKTMDMLARLAPGANDRNLAGNLIFGLNTAASGAASVMGGNAAALAFPILQATAGVSGRSVGNAMAAAEFRRLRDRVALGNAAPPRRPGERGNRAANFMVTDAISGEPR